MKKPSSIFLSFAILFSPLLSAAPAWAQGEEAAAGTVFSAPVRAAGAAPGTMALPLDAAEFSLVNPAAITETLEQASAVQIDGLNPAAPHEAALALPAPSVAASLASPQAAVIAAPRSKASGALTLLKKSSSRVSSLRRLVKTASRGLSAAVLNGLFDFNLGRQPALVPVPVRNSFSRRGFAPPDVEPLPKLRLPDGGELEADPSPIVPDTRHLPASNFNFVNSFAIPNTEIINQAVDTALAADPTSATAIEGALRRMIDQNPQYGITSAELGTAYVHQVGAPNQLPTWEVSFRQQKLGMDAAGAVSPLPIYGASLTFIIHVEDGKPIIRGVHGRLFPGISVDTAQRLSAQDMLTNIRGRLRLGAAATAQNIHFMERQIVYLENKPEKDSFLTKILDAIRDASSKTRRKTRSRTPSGAWHAVNLYRVDKLDAFAAVDVASGKVFLWDMRLGAAAGSGAAKAGAQFESRAPKTDHDMGVPNHLSQIPMPEVTVTLPDGRQIVSDLEGRIAVDLPGGKPLTVTARLDSPFVTIVNEAGSPIQVQATLIKGQDGSVVVFNPPAQTPQPRRRTGPRAQFAAAARLMRRTISPEYKAKDNAARKKASAEELALSQVTTYLSAYNFMTWNKAHGIGVSDGIWNRKFVINVNINDNCNAYMDPSDFSRNFFQSDAECINTGTLPGVIYHESGHLVHYLVAGYAAGQAREVLSALQNGTMPHPVPSKTVLASVDGGLSEGIGDMFATHMEETPLIGEHFFNDPRKPPLRDTRNTYQFNSGDEVHEQGLAWMGFSGYGGKLHLFLSKALGAAAGLALEQSLLFPHLYGYAAASDIPTAMQVVYLAASALTNPAERAAAMKAVVQAAAAHGVQIGGTASAAAGRGRRTPVHSAS